MNPSLFAVRLEFFLRFVISFALCFTISGLSTSVALAQLTPAHEPLGADAAATSLPASYLPTTPLPDAPSSVLLAYAAPDAGRNVAPTLNGAASYSSSLPASPGYTLYPAGYEPQQSADAQTAKQSDHPANPQNLPLDENGRPIPLNRQQPKRILGFMPNFRSVSAGAAVHPPGWKYNFRIATRQAFDYSSFIFLGLTTATAYAQDSHPSLDTYNGGSFPFYGYLWRGLLDKTDGTYLGAWLLPSILHQDNRYYPLGDGHSILARSLYVISRQAVTRTYGGRQTFNLSGLGGKVLTQYISRFYYPPNSSGFSVLATKFAYSAMRDIGFSSIREFYPDVAAHYVQKHREKVAQLQSDRDVQATQSASTPAHP